MTVEYDESAAVYRVCSLFTVSLAVAAAMLSPPMEQLPSSVNINAGNSSLSCGSIEGSHVADQIIDGASVTTDEASRGGSQSGGMTSSSSRLFRILVVDDSSICQKLLVKILRQHSFVTDVANNGQEACDKLIQEPCSYDAVLMDIRMPVNRSKRWSIVAAVLSG
jgi:CheY-like chemotaxis protein